MTEVTTQEQVVEVVEVVEAVKVAEVAKQEVEVISIDDDLLPSPGATGPYGRNLRSETELQDTDEICVYNDGRHPSVVISYGTYKTLQHETWVNDVIIDYYLSYLREKKLNKEDARRQQRAYLLHNVLRVHAQPAIWQKCKAR